MIICKALFGIFENGKGTLHKVLKVILFRVNVKLNSKCYVNLNCKSKFTVQWYLNVNVSCGKNLEIQRKQYTITHSTHSKCKIVEVALKYVVAVEYSFV